MNRRTPLVRFSPPQPLLLRRHPRRLVQLQHLGAERRGQRGGGAEVAVAHVHGHHGGRGEAGEIGRHGGTSQPYRKPGRPGARDLPHHPGSQARAGSASSASSPDGTSRVPRRTRSR